MSGRAYLWDNWGETGDTDVSQAASEYVEIRAGDYSVAGTRIGLDVLVYSFRLGKSPEAILQAHPSIGSLAKVYGAIAFILDNPEVVETYLRNQEALWDKLRETHPLPLEALERFRRAREEVAPKSS